MEQRQVSVDRVGLDEPQHERGRADLDEVGHVGLVGVADDDVEPAPDVGVGVGFVPGVDDRPLEGRLQPHLRLEEVAAGRHLVAGALALLADADAPGAAHHLAGDEERGQAAHDPVEGVARLTR